MVTVFRITFWKVSTWKDICFRNSVRNVLTKSPSPSSRCGHVTVKQGQPHQENCHYNFKCWSCDWLLLIVCEVWSTPSGELPLLNLQLTLPMTLHAPSRSQFVFITSINRLYLDKLPTLVSFIINISGYIILIIKYFQWKTLLPMTLSINATLSVYKQKDWQNRSFIAA